MYNICKIFLLDVRHYVRNIVDYSGRIGGKPFLELPGSLAAPNIGEKQKIKNFIL